MRAASTAPVTAPLRVPRVILETRMAQGFPGAMVLFVIIYIMRYIDGVGRSDLDDIRSQHAGVDGRVFRPAMTGSETPCPAQAVPFPILCAGEYSPTNRVQGHRRLGSVAGCP